MSSTILTLTSGALQNLYFLNLYYFKYCLLYGLKYDTRKHFVEVVGIWDLVEVFLFPHNVL